ncbi:forkhead-associated domain-containing protein 1 [Pterocles gutturalis]
MRAFLKSSEGCFQLKPCTTTIGRHQGADIVLQSPGVAEHHAVLEFTASDNGFVLQDCNSPHGTFVNGCQVQNAAVKVIPGDVLRFGRGGAAFQLVMDGAAQVSCPPVNRRTAWAGQLQLVAEPQPSPPASPPRLPALQRQHPPSSPAGWAPGPTTHLPHPPPRQRPGSARAWSTATTVPPDAFVRSPLGRPASTSVSSDGASAVGTAPSLGYHDTDFLPREKGEKLLRLGRAIGRLSGLEMGWKPKEAVIRDLQDEIAAMAKTLVQAVAGNEAELAQMLLALDRELGAKTEEIKSLQEQLSDLQKGSSQVFSHSLHERDLELGRLRQEGEKLKRDQALAAGLVTSLQREIAGKEQKMQQVQQDLEKMKKENREKDKQLAVVSAKCSRIKEETKRELEEQEVAACRHRIGELERDLEVLRGEVQKYRAEQESVRSQLAKKAKAAEELEEACARREEQLREMGRRERLLRADAGRAREQLESFKTQVLQACSPAAAGVAGKGVTEQQVMEKVRQISDENQQSHEREKSLQEELSSRISKEKEVSENVEVLKKSLQELQVCLRSSCSSDSLQEELGRLGAAFLGPPVSAIAAAVLEVARVPLSWLEDVERLLASVGMDLSASRKGLVAALEELVENNRETAKRNQMLQGQLERGQEAYTALQEHVKELDAKHEQELRIKINQIILEKDKENQENLERAVTEEKDKCQRSLEEEKKTIQDLESHLRSMTEVMERKLEEQEAADRKLREAERSLEEAAEREMTLQQLVLVRDEQLRTVQEEKEFQQQKQQEEIMEYKEQIKQHSLTIVALEERVVEAEQRQKMLEEENAALMAKMEGRQGDAHEPTSGAGLEAAPAAETHSCLRWVVAMVGRVEEGKFQEELAEVQSVLLSKETIIAQLTKELVGTRARMSDLRGELSEEQKVELERNVSRVRQQERELNLLREQLSRMSGLVEMKDRALEAAAEELRQARADCQALKDASRETAEKPEDAPESPARAGEASEGEPVSDLANLGAKCRGLRHEETIQRQKEGLAELRERIKMLEKMRSSAAVNKVSEPLVVLTKDLPEQINQKTGLEKEPASVSGAKLNTSRVPGRVANGGLQGATDGAASSERGDATDLGEKMYLEVIGALGRLLEVQELAGMQPLRHLPREEREKAGRQRQKDLTLLYDRIRNLKRRLERREEMLKDYEAGVEQLRLDQASLRRCREEMSKLEGEAHREAEEKALLREALERTRLQLSQEKKRAAKPHTPAAKKPFCSGKMKAGAVKMGSA